LRAQQMRNLLATLFFAQGTPMLLAGDEFGRTQHGNNNAYCQDNELSWVDWNIDEQGDALIAFCRRLIALRRSHPILRRRRFLVGHYNEELGVKDVTWLAPDGEEMTEAHWHDSQARCMGMLMDGRAQPTGVKRSGADATLLLLLNAHHDTCTFVLPEVAGGKHWSCLIDTHQPLLEPTPQPLQNDTLELPGRSLQLLELQR
jgi:isoamylase